MFFTTEFLAHYAPDACTRFVARLNHYVMLWPIIHLMHNTHLISAQCQWVARAAADPLSQAQVGTHASRSAAQLHPGLHTPERPRRCAFLVVAAASSAASELISLSDAQEHRTPAVWVLAHTCSINPLYLHAIAPMCEAATQTDPEQADADAMPTQPWHPLLQNTHKHHRAAGKATHALTSFTSAGMLATQSGVCARFLWVNTAVCGSHLSIILPPAHTRPQCTRSCSHIHIHTRSARPSLTHTSTHTHTHTTQRRSCWINSAIHTHSSPPDEGENHIPVSVCHSLNEIVSAH